MQRKRLLLSADDDDDDDDPLLHVANNRYTQSRDALNLPRKVQHAISGLIFAFLCNRYYSEFYLFLTFLTFVTFVVEILRRIDDFAWINGVIYLFCGSTLRQHEMMKHEDGSGAGVITNMTGSFYFFLGSWLTMSIFSSASSSSVPATIGILHLGLADPAASYFGYHTRHILWSRVRGKGLFGVLGGALFCLPFSFIIFSCTNWICLENSWIANIGISIQLGLSAAIADFIIPSPTVAITPSIFTNILGLSIHIPAVHVDDNVIVPLATAGTCYILLNSIGWDKNFDSLSPLLFMKER